MKRPAGNNTSKASKITNKPLTCCACIRCRGNFGNVHGCVSCNFEGLQGLRLNGRAAWHAYMAKQALSSSCTWGMGRIGRDSGNAHVCQNMGKHDAREKFLPKEKWCASTLVAYVCMCNFELH